MTQNSHQALAQALQEMRKRLGQGPFEVRPHRSPEYYALSSIRAVHSHQIRILRKLFRLMSKGLKDEIVDIEQTYAEEMEGFEEQDEDYRWLENEVVEELAYYLYEVPLLAYQYLLVSCFAHFEYALTETCRRFAELQGESFSLDGLWGSHIEKCQRYFKKVLCLPFPDGTQVWAELKTIGRLRNCIVHNLGDWRNSRWEKEIRALFERVMLNDLQTEDDESGFYAELATDDKLKSEVEAWRRLCLETFSIWTQFIGDLADQLDAHFGFESWR